MPSHLPALHKRKINTSQQTVYLVLDAELVAVAGKISISFIQCQADKGAKEHRGR